MPVADVLTDPDAFMERRAGERRYAREVALVVLLGALGAIGPLYFAYVMLRLVENPTGTVRDHLLGVVLVPFLMVFGAWVVYAAVAHALARLYGGRGRFGQLFRLTAWALLPLGIGYLARSVAFVLAFRSLYPEELAAEVAAADPGGEVLAGFEAGNGETAVLLGTVVLAASILWSGYLLSFAVERAEGIPRRSAVKVAVLPATVYALYELVDGVLSHGVGLA